MAVGMRLLVGGIPLGGAGDKAQGLVLIGGCGTEPHLQPSEIVVR